MTKLLRYISYMVGIVLTISIGISLIKVVKKNYDLKIQIATLEQEKAILETQNQELIYKIAYYNTASFQDKEARAKLGLQDPSEKVLILSTNQQNKTKDITTPKVQVKSNFQQWLDFLLGRATNT